MTDEIKIGIGGTAVYKAVRNYLNNSPDLKKTIDDQVQRLVDAGTLEEIARRKMAEILTVSYMKELLRESAKNILTEEIKSKVEKITIETMKKHLEGAIVVVPKNNG